MTTNKPEVSVIYALGTNKTVKMVRLSDYEDLQVECEKLRERVAELKRLCDRLQHCALGFYMDQGDHSHMEAIMKDYHAIMWGDDIDAYRKGEES